LFDQLPVSARGADPLLQACEELSILRSRSPEHAADLIDFTDRFIAAFGFDESVTQKRLRHAACYLGDIAWRGHPDYRGAQAVDSAAFGAFVGVDHSGRAHLARLLAVRYAGLKRKHVSNDDIFDLCKPKHAFHADMIGALFRVAYLFSAAMPGVLPLIQWAKTETGIEIRLPNGMELLAAEKTVRRVEQLAAFIEAEISIVTQ
jgi:exopolyphosphatase/guanosine-5'-triphosphate,3'-diphosphate pyrophosphatase